jgi:hypothetical protein
VTRGSSKLDPYSLPLLRALVLQVVLLLIYSQFLDLGQHLQACQYSSVGFWLGVVLILVRRRATPTPGDLTYIRWGLLPMW